MFKILTYGMTANYGGIEVYLVNMLKNINKDNFKIDYVIIGEKSPLEEDIKDNGGKIYYIPKKEDDLFGNISTLNSLFKKLSKEYDCIYFNSGALFYGIPYILARIHKFKKIIVHAHNGKDPNRKFYENILHYINRCIVNHISDYKFSCSDIATKWIFGKKYINNGVHIINNAIDCSKYDYDYKIREKICKQLGIDKNCTIIGNVGRLDKQKNQEFLIEVFYKIINKQKDSILLIIGDGNLKEELMDKAKKMNIDNKIKFLGVRNDISDLLNAMDAFVLPSLFEGFPITLVEAQVSGIPCFVSDTVTKEVNKTGLIKYVSLQESPEDWADIILSTIPNIERKSHYLDMCEFGYDQKSNIKKIENILLDIK